MANGKQFSAEEAVKLANEIKAFLVEDELIEEVVVCGSIRRKKAKVGDVDLAIFAETESYCKIWDRIPSTVEWETRGPVSRRWYYKGLKFDARIFKPAHRGAALLTRTGSARLNIVMRGEAKKQGFLLNEYGVFKDDRNLSLGWNEKQIFTFLGFEYKKPEERSDITIEVKVREQSEWIVPSKSGSGEYRVWFDDGEFRCECKGFKFRRSCWHTKFIEKEEVKNYV